MASAGYKVNVIPGTASAHFDGRLLPGWTQEGFLAEIRSVIGNELAIHVHEHHAGTSAGSRSDLLDVLTRTLKSFDPQGIPLPYMNPAFTDSFAYARLGAICYGFAPVRLGPEMEFSRMFHGHDERIPVEGYLWGQRALLHAVASFCAEKPAPWLDALVPHCP